MICSRTIKSSRIFLECDPSFEPAAGDIFDTLAGLAGSGAALEDGFRMRFGWSLLTLRSEPDGLRVCEPRFEGSDPRTELNPTLDITLRVLVDQLRWLRRVGEQGTDIFFDQNVIVTHEAAASSDLFALRGESTSPTDSGWSVAPVPQPGGMIETSRLSAVPICSLVDARFGLLSVLALPKGYLVRLQDDKVVEITDPGGKVRWPSPILLG